MPEWPVYPAFSPTKPPIPADRKVEECTIRGTAGPGKGRPTSFTITKTEPGSVLGGRKISLQGHADEYMVCPASRFSYTFNDKEAFLQRVQVTSRHSHVQHLMWGDWIGSGCTAWLGYSNIQDDQNLSGHLSWQPFPMKEGQYVPSSVCNLCGPYIGLTVPTSDGHSLDLLLKMRTYGDPMWRLVSDGAEGGYLLPDTEVVPVAGTEIRYKVTYYKPSAGPRTDKESKGSLTGS